MSEEGGGGSKKGKKARTREKKQRTGRKHESLKIHSYYEVKDGTVTRKRDFCHSGSSACDQSTSIGPFGC